MTTLNGLIRSTNATLHRMERAHEQRARRVAQIERLRLKKELPGNTAATVQRYIELVSLLTSVHREATEQMDWRAVLDAPAPVPPVKRHDLEKKATEMLALYTPTFLDKLLGRTAKKKRLLEESVVAAGAGDAAVCCKWILFFTKTAHPISQFPLYHRQRSLPYLRGSLWVSWRMIRIMR